MKKEVKGINIYIYLKVNQKNKRRLIIQLFFLLLKIIYQVQEVAKEKEKIIPL